MAIAFSLLPQIILAAYSAKALLLRLHRKIDVSVNFGQQILTDTEILLRRGLL